MEKFINRGIIIILAVIIFFVFNKIRIASTSHHANIEHIEKHDISNKIISMLNEYLLENFEYPEELDDILGMNNLLTEEADNIWIDPFSNDSSRYAYFPIYDNKSKKRMAFIILSAGIDGKVDLIGKDSIFMDEINNHLLAYNPKSINKSEQEIDFKVGFSMLDQVKGNKDLVLAFVKARKVLGENAIQYTDNLNLEESNNSLFKFSIREMKDIEREKETLTYAYNNSLFVIKLIEEFDEDAEELVAQFHGYDSASANWIFVNGIHPTLQK